jgi:hypothetical protein
VLKIQDFSCEATGNLHDCCDDSATVSDCESVLNEITAPKFVLSLIIRHEVSFRGSKVSHLWQNVKTRSHKALPDLGQFSALLQEYWSPGFEAALTGARDLASTTFKDKRTFAKKECIITRTVMIPYQT